LALAFVALSNLQRLADVNQDAELRAAS